MKDFDKWNVVKRKTDLTEKRPPVRVGEIYWCKIGLNIGVEQDGKDEAFQRPVLVIKKFSNEIILITPLTSKEHAGDWYSEINFENKKSWCVLNQTKPIDTKRLLSSMGEISEKELSKIINTYCNLIQKK